MNVKNKYYLDFLAASVRIYHDVVNPIRNLPFGNVFFYHPFMESHWGLC
jgi:hypothetical protein